MERRDEIMEAFDLFNAKLDELAREAALIADELVALVADPSQAQTTSEQP